MLHKLSTEDYSHRSYIVSAGDSFSAGKAVEFEESLASTPEPPIAHQQRHLQEQERERDQVSRNVNATVQSDMPDKSGYSVHSVPRARRIHQSLLTTPFSCVHCLLATLSLLYTHPRSKPDLVVTNGPATALIVILSILVLEYFSFMPGLDRYNASYELVAPSMVDGDRNRGDRGERKSNEVRTARSIYIESWARVRRPSLSCWIIVQLGLCDRVLVQWKQLEDAGWGEYRGVLIR